jgi:hypothetical protein
VEFSSPVPQDADRGCPGRVRCCSNHTSTDGAHGPQIDGEPAVEGSSLHRRPPAVCVSRSMECSCSGTDTRSPNILLVRKKPATVNQEVAEIEARGHPAAIPSLTMRGSTRGTSLAEGDRPKLFRPKSVDPGGVLYCEGEVGAERRRGAQSSADGARECLLDGSDARGRCKDIGIAGFEPCFGGGTVLRGGSCPSE